jgi:hypothetical protein
VKAAARHGSTSPAEAVGHLPAATRRALDTAAGHGFQSGLHLAMLISALILFACAATAAALLRPRP